MNMPPPPQRFHRYNKAIAACVEEGAIESMLNSVRDAVLHDDGDRDIGAMFDGTWQKRGYSSLNGLIVASSIDTGKILDIECLSKYCFICKGKH